MKITIEYLKKIDACQEAINEYKKVKEPKTIKKCFQLLLRNKKFDWANWFICKIMNEKQRIQYAIFAAKQVLYIYESKYPNDNRPRNAIKSAEKYLKNPTEKNKNDSYAAAAAAAYVAAAAVYDDDAAAYAAAYVAAAAVYDDDAAAYAAAAYAAAAVYDDDAAAAVYDDDAAAAAAAYVAAAYVAAALKIKIIKYGLKLLNIKLKEIC